MERFLLIDTETCGSLAHPIAYDVGAVVCDRYGKIYDRAHFLVREIFADLPRMATAYYAEKFVGYLDRIESGSIKVKPFSFILTAIDNLVEKWDIKTLCAYNLAFDLRAMKNTTEFLFDNSEWCKYELKNFCIMCAACDVLYGKKYIKACRAHGWETENGNVKTSAECGYRYLTGNYDFVEEHRGADDCEIEAEILAAVFRTHKHFNRTVKPFPMRAVYAREHE